MRRKHNDCARGAPSGKVDIVSMSAALAAVVVEAKDGSRSGCCGTPACGHTVIQHGSHRGFLNNGQLLCRPAVGLPLVPCTLDMDDWSCSLIEGQDGHIHGPGCGHEQVPHGEHMDYLVGGRLHHQVASGICCSRSCLKELPISAVVDHGPVTVLRHRSTAQRQPQDCSASTSSRAQLTLNDEQPASAMHRSSSHLSDDSSVVQQPENEVITKVYAAGICCPSEVGIVHRVLEGLPGVSEVQVNAVSKVVTVRHDAAATSPATLVATLNAARLEATLGTKEVVTGRASWLPPHYILGCGLLLLVSLFSYLPASGTGYLKYAALGCLVLGMPPVLLKAWVALRGWQVDINVLMTVAVAGALALQDFVEPAIIVFLFSFAQWLEHRCISQASNAVAALLTLQPETAVLADSGMAVPVGQVVVGDRILVRPGDRVACDGVVESGCGSVDQSMLTGEARAVVKSLEDAVFGGTINVGGTTLVVRVTSASADSSLAKLAQVMESAMAHKTKRELVLERFARIYSPVVIASAILLAAVPSALDPSQWHHWVYLALEVLVTACPCALVLSAPVANVCALTRAAQHGVLLKSSSVLQAFASLEVLSFDKTGTLTQGHFALVETLTMPHRWTEDQLLQLAAALEQHCNHPLAASIIGEAASRGLPWLMADDVVVLPGVGVEGRVGSHLVTLCSLAALVTWMWAAEGIRNHAPGGGS
ncbi:hypothetical protein OEZ86_010205 [Tetradesmus obliquus]|nr:hypothetical protein OEZ86_010205 [Tetradesmus obliquus]